MDTMQLILILVLTVLAGYLAYRNMLKKRRSGDAGNLTGRDKVKESTQEKPDDYEPYSERDREKE